MGKDAPNGTDREEFLVPGQGKKDFREFGQHLRRERELRKIPLEEIAQVTRINHKYLAALEDGRQESLPALPFVKGFIAAYAKHIGLNIEEVLTYYDEIRLGRAEETEAALEPVPYRRGLPVLLVGTAAGAVILAAFCLWMFRKPGPAPEPPAAPAGEVSAPQPAEGSAPAAPQPGEGVSLVLESSEKSWVYAILDEQSVKDFFMQPGEKADLAAQRVINLTLGNSGGVNVTFNGRDLGPLGKSNEVKRDILFTWDTQKGAEMKDIFSRAQEVGN